MRCSPDTPGHVVATANPEDVEIGQGPKVTNPTQLAESLSHASLRDLKQAVSKAVIEGLGGIRERYIELLSVDEGRYLDAVEAKGASKARLNANETMVLVREATGL
ncbi:Tryptophan--tRNA ligase, mitochondrial [Colletotrichum sp. CLE4]